MLTAVGMWGTPGWYVFHKNCPGCRENPACKWAEGPYRNEEAANSRRNDLAGPDSCPGCGRETPNADNYTVLKIV